MNSIPPTVKESLWPWPHLELTVALGILPEVAPRLFSLSFQRLCQFSWSRVLWCWKSSQASVITAKICKGKLLRDTVDQAEKWTEQRLICYWPTDWPKCHFSPSTLDCEKQKWRKKSDSIRVKWGIQIPLRTQQWIHTDEPQRHSIAASSDILQIVVQCHLGEPEATEGSEQTLRENAQR